MPCYWRTPWCSGGEWEGVDPGSNNLLLSACSQTSLLPLKRHIDLIIIKKIPLVIVPSHSCIPDNGSRQDWTVNPLIPNIIIYAPPSLLTPPHINMHTFCSLQLRMLVLQGSRRLDPLHLHDTFFAQSAWSVGFSDSLQLTTQKGKKIQTYFGFWTEEQPNTTCLKFPHQCWDRCNYLLSGAFLF